MRASKYGEQQIIGFFNQATAEMGIKGLCCKEGFSEGTFYKWRAKYGGLKVSESVRLREIEAENGEL